MYDPILFFVRLKCEIPTLHRDSFQKLQYFRIKTPKKYQLRNMENQAKLVYACKYMNS